MTVKNQYPFNCKVASKTRCNVLKRCSSLKGSQQVGQTKTFLNRLHALFLVLLLVACEQQTPSNVPLQSTLMPTAAMLVENSSNGGEASNSSVSPVTSNTVTTENASGTPTVEPSFIPVVQQTPISLATPLPPVTFADDGSHILFLEEWHDDILPTLYAMKPDGSDWVVLSSELGYGTRLLDSSPDGSWVLLSHGEKGTYTLKLDTSQEERLLDSGFASSGAWSPDGQYVLLVIDEALLLADVSSGQVTPIPLPLASNMPEVLTTDMDFFPVASHIEGMSWAPDSRWFAFQQSGLTGEEQQAAGLYRYTLATGTVETLYLDEHHRFRTRFYRDYNLQAFPLVSPNGATILTDLGTHHGLATVPATGGDLTILSNMQLPLVEPPQWSPNGEWLAVVYADDVYLIRADGSASRRLTYTPDLPERELAWSSDGLWLVGVVEAAGLFRLDVGAGVVAWYSEMNPTLTRFWKQSPQWIAPADSGSVPWAEIAILATTETPPGYPIPPTPPADIALDPPALTLDPPWWGNHYFYRRQILLPDDLPLPDSPFAPPVLVQVSYTNNELPGRSPRLVWWGGAAAGWHELPYVVNEVEEISGTITFPLQVGPDGNMGNYYFYYGAPGPVQPHYSSLYELTLGVDPLDRDATIWTFNLDVNSLGYEEEIERETSIGSINFPIGFQSRPVLELASPESRTSLHAFLQPFVETGSLQIWLRPQTNNPNGSILVGEEFPFFEPSFGDEINLEQEPDSQSILSYTAGTFYLQMAGNSLEAPYTLSADTWYHLAFTWQANGALRFYVNGTLLAETPYDIPFYEGVMPNGFPFPFGRPLGIGAIGDMPALTGQYANLFSFAQTLNETQIQKQYLAQLNVQATLAPEAEMAVTQATIGPDGGWLRSPDGRGWVEFTSGAVSEATEVYWLAYHSSGDVRPDHLQRYVLVTGEAWRAYVESPELREGLQFLPAPQFNAPIHLYYQYDPVAVLEPNTVVMFRWDEAKEEWVPYPTYLVPEANLVLSLDIANGGSFTVANNFGLGFPPPIR